MQTEWYPCAGDDSCDANQSVCEILTNSLNESNNRNKKKKN